MKHLLIIVLLFVAAALFAQSNYEIMFNRPDITGLTGGGATNLDSIPTTGLATGTILAVTYPESIRCSNIASFLLG